MWTILRKDLRIELRTWAGLSSLFVLGLLVLLIFQFATPEKPTPESAAAALWLSFLFAGTIGAQRTFLLERENLCMHGLLTAPLDASSIFVAKMLGTLVTLAILQTIVVPLTAMFFKVNPFARPFEFTAVCLLGNAGFSAVATLFAALSVRIRGREMLLPLLLFPVLVPLLIAAVRASAIVLGAAGDVGPWLRVLVAFDVLFAVAGWLLFEHVVRE